VHVLGHATLLPQLSMAVAPQAMPAQVVATGFGVQQAPFTHCEPVPHIPQFTARPHASVVGPHATPLLAQRFVSLRSGLQAPATHSSPVGHAPFLGPQASTPPQPSLMTPQVTLAGQAVIFLQAPHWKLRASQTWLPPQAGQLSVPPHPSLGLPHWNPSELHVPGLHATQVCEVASHVSLAGHVPQLRV
jgi:hypothetical protein